SPRYMSPEQVQEDTISNQTDLFSLGIVMYELLTGKHPFIADSFSRLIHKIINEQQPPLSTYRSDLPEILERIVHHALQKSALKRYTMGLNMAADLSLAFDYLENPEEDINEQELFNALQEMEFFNDFPETEIWEIIQACVWQTCNNGEQIIIEGDIDDSFYIIIAGTAEVSKEGYILGELNPGDCFGEMGYLEKTKRTATIKAKEEMQLIKINATLIDQVSTECQLRFSKVFLRTLVRRLSHTNLIAIAKTG
ncbi:MAG: cyclic nucleotide-binding domain-containing protein, partial [Gammaproteobacteria bacterium]|nr:cyclic nucleotide-binding domain-containing protein [Gammaproteobacteria bacterium]